MFRRPRPAPQEYAAVQERYNFTHSNEERELDCEFEEALDQAERLEETYGLPSSILVVGCRTGYEVRAFAGYFPTAIVAGMDIVPLFVQCARLHATRNLVIADMHDIPFEDNFFDWVYSTGTLEHAHDPKRVVEEMCRVSRHLVYVTADIVEEYRNKSHFSFSTEPQEWIDLFPKPWKVHSWTDHVRVHMEAQRWTPTL